MNLGVGRKRGEEEIFGCGKINFNSLHTPLQLSILLLPFKVYAISVTLGDTVEICHSCS